MKKGYVILEVGWEYNDEYYSTNNNGDTYEAPNEVFFDKTKAEQEMEKRQIKSYKENHLMSYFGEEKTKIYDKNIKINESVNTMIKGIDNMLKE